MRGTRSGADFDRVRERATSNPLEVLVCFAGGYAKRMKRNGDGWRGPCPLHAGDNPNFALSKDGLWKCHSKCDKGGDILDLARRLSGHAETKDGWRAVLEQLASHFGVALGERATPYRAAPRKPLEAPTPPKGPVPPPLSPLEELRADGVHVASAGEIHTAILGSHLTLGPRAVAYLQSRGFDAEPAIAYGFRSIETQDEWAALEAFLSESFLPEERGVAGVATLYAWAGACLVIPFRSHDGTGFCGFRLRSLEPNCPKERRYLSLKGYSLPLPFNGEALATCAGHELHVVEGELNAYTLTLYGLPAIGLAGAGGGKWRPEWSAAIKQAARLVAWFDNDKAGEAGKDKLAAKLAEVCGSAWVKSHGRSVLLANQDVNDRHQAGTLSALISQAGWRK